MNQPPEQHADDPVGQEPAGSPQHPQQPPNEQPGYQQSGYQQSGHQQPPGYDPNAYQQAGWDQAAYQQAYGEGYAPPQQTHGYAMVGYGPLGQTRGTLPWFLLFVVTFGIAGLVWYFKVFQEMKLHTGTGLGGGLGLLIGFLSVGPFVSGYEVGQMYQRAGQAPPVSGWTGCWVFLPFIGGIIWFAKVNEALNDYWRALGAV